MFADTETQWQGYTYLAQDTVETIQSVTSRGAEELSYALDMQNRSPWERGLFLATVGQVQARTSWATSLLAHEYAHFANAHRFGLTEHYFVDEVTGEQFDFAEAWMRTFLHGDPGGPAFSGLDGEPLDYELDAEEGIERSLAGLNWQMSYSEMRLRGWLSGERRTIFDLPDMFMNRIYLLSYSLGSHMEINGSSWGGDPGRFIKVMEEEHGEEDVSEKMILTALAGNIASTSLTQMTGGITGYIRDGEMEVVPHSKRFRTNQEFFWDVPQYLNKNNMSVSPTVYWLPSDNLRHAVAADNLLVGVSFEKSVFGVNNKEARVTIDGSWHDFGLNAGLSLGSEGSYLDIRANYQLSDHAALTAGMGHTSGETMRGARELPDADSLIWFGANFSF